MGYDALILGTSRRRNGKRVAVEIVAAKGEGASEMARCGPAYEGRSHQTVNGIKEMKQVSGDLLREICQIKERLAQIVESILLSDSTRSALARGSDLYKVVEAGFDPMILVNRSNFDGLWKSEGKDFLIQALVQNISIEIPNERVSIFVGPSGSGKTTSVLKVAATKVRLGEKPIVIELVGNRSRKSDFLKGETKRLGAKFLRITGAAKLEDLMKNKKAPILVDTPGLSEIPDGDLRLLADLSGRYPEVRMHLVIEARMDAHNVYAIASCIPEVPRLGMALTKLDETSRIGGVLSASMEAGLPLTYLTGGFRSTDAIFIPTHDLIFEKISESLKQD